MDEIDIKIITSPPPLPIDKIPPWLLTAAQQIKEPPLDKKIIAGPHAKTLNEIYKTASEADDEKLEIEQQKKIFETDTLVPANTETLIDTGGLDIPATFYKQEDVQTCAAACFRMILNDALKESITEQELVSALYHAGLISRDNNYDMVDYHNLLRLINTSAFKNQFKTVALSGAPLIGTDFNHLKEMIARIKMEGRKLYVCCSVESEILPGTLHEVVLLEVRENIVVVHDPAKNDGNRKEIDKTVFLKRWLVGNLCGYLILAKSIQ